MITFMELQERCLNGPVMKTDDFDLALSMKVRELVDKYNINYDADQLVVDDETADNVFQAGVDLLADVGLYHLGTQRVVEFTKDEILEFVKERKENPAEIHLGQGNEKMTIKYRTSKDSNPPTLYAGAAGAIEEEEFLAFMQSFAQEEQIKGMGIAGGIMKVGDMDPKAGTLSEIQCAIWEQDQLKEVLNRVDRPGLSLGLVCTASTVGATIQSVRPDFRGPHNTHIGIHVIPEQKIDWDRLILSHFCQDRAIIPWQSAMSLIGGLYRHGADAAVGMVANVLGHMSYGYGPMCSLFPTNMDGTWATRATNWTFSAAARASERNIHLATGSAIAPRSEYGRRPIGFLMEAASAVAYTASGLGYAWIAGGTGAEACFLGDIMNACAGISREKAIEVTNAIMKRVDEKLENSNDSEKPTEPCPFPELYDLKTVKPKQGYLDDIARAKDELADLGVPL